MITVEPIPAFTDNYLWLIHNGRAAAVVDPGDGAAVASALEARGLDLSAILVTHHHPDHVGGIGTLLRKFHVPVYGPRAEAAKIAAIDHPLDDADRLRLEAPGLELEVLAVPGHTLGHIAYHGLTEPGADPVLFCGDTLFSAGCGRLFEGTPQQMFDSLNRLRRLAPQTRVYCAHEYTLSNLAFAQALEPDSRTIATEIAHVVAQRAEGRPSLPTSLAREQRINPFLRCTDAALAAAAERHAGRDLTSAVEVFAALRAWKDSFVPPRATA